MSKEDFIKVCKTYNPIKIDEFLLENKKSNFYFSEYILIEICKNIDATNYDFIPYFVEHFLSRLGGCDYISNDVIIMLDHKDTQLGVAKEVFDLYRKWCCKLSLDWNKKTLYKDIKEKESVEFARYIETIYKNNITHLLYK